MKIKLLISYDGTAYSGWQVQKNAITVQQTLQDAVERVFGQRYSITGCSRTDSGVHALEYCCSVNLGEDVSAIPSEKIPIALNCFLPEDIAVLYAEYIDEDFHPRYDVSYKEYEYVIWNNPIRNAFLNNKAFFFPKLLNDEIMDKAAKVLVGKHDFSSFMSSGSTVENTVRDIKYFTVRRDGERVVINVAADGFLYNMVRILVGTLVEVSEGKIDIENLPVIIEKKDRKYAGFTAPPQGLYLKKVFY